MWFAPKSYGYGSGLPITWEGWAVLGLFFAALFTLRWAAFDYFSGGMRAAMFVGGTALLIVPLILVCRARTEGGWKWRDGCNDD